MSGFEQNFSHTFNGTDIVGTPQTFARVVRVTFCSSVPIPWIIETHSSLAQSAVFLWNCNNFQRARGCRVSAVLNTAGLLKQ